MRIATWNINHRAGRFFNLEAAAAACALGADLVALTEFAPRRQSDEVAFLDCLGAGGLAYLVASPAPPAGTPGNRVLVASRLPIERHDLRFPAAVDVHVPANVVAARVPSQNLKLIALRVPYYKGARARSLTLACWEWLATTAAAHAEEPCVVTGDLNVSMTSRETRGAIHFRSMLSKGWSRVSVGPTFPDGAGGGSEIDHIMATPHCELRHAAVVLQVGQHQLAGADSALSDHAALVCDVSVTAPVPASRSE